MNWILAIEKNREALRRILAMIAAMVSMSASGISEQQVGESRRATLPRHLHRFVMRLLRPAEAATRRLIIIAARGLVVRAPRLRPRKAKLKPEPQTILVLDRVNGSIVSVPIVLPERERISVPSRAGSHTLSLPLFDKLIRFGGRRRYARPAVAPRIRSFDGSSKLTAGSPGPPPPSPDDPLDARRLHRRLDAIGRALDDLPGHANRLARWRARRDAMLAQEKNRRADGVPDGGDGVRRMYRSSPMRPGRPPGWRRRPNHDVYEVLNELHGLAFWALERPDTS